MLVLLSPAKRLNWDDTASAFTSEPEFSKDAAALARVAGRLSAKRLESLMGISPSLAKLNYARFKAFEETPKPEITRAAISAFAGDTYIGLEARTLSDDALDWSDRHLRILSGLYGLLRPKDGIQPYRLEMGSRLKTRKAPNLYGYWGARLSHALNAQAEQTGSRMVLNCASQEYFKAVDRASLNIPVITPTFLEERAGETKMISFFAKKARGAMARFSMENRVTDVSQLKDFDSDGYSFDPELSSELSPVFVRKEVALEASA